jgi:holo-[acyl-carrier-protein] synthase
MIFGIGVDVLEAARIKKTLARFGDHFVDRLLMPAERAQLARTKRPERFIAMRFAAKEAIVKAMGTGFAHGIWIRDVGVVQNAWGKPEVAYSPRGEKMRRKLGIGDGHVTLTDEAGLIVAVAVLEAPDETLGEGAPPMNTLVFDIETVPDVEFGRRLFGLEGLSDDEVGKAMQARARQESGSDFLPHEQHRIVAISCAFRSREGFRVWSLGDESATERELVERFFDGIDKFTPELVSWNGGGFDLPVLHYRALRFQVQAPRYWETGDEDNAFRYNNYLGRFHWRHVDVMDVLSGYQNRARASLSDTAVLLGYPGKLGFDGSQVWDAYRAGELTRIRRYCETDVINTWLVFLRFQHMRGRLTDAGLADELARTRAWLTEAKQPHLDEFLAAWGAAS